jgi:hypothetical protein
MNRPFMQLSAAEQKYHLGIWLALSELGEDPERARKADASMLDRHPPPAETLAMFVRESNIPPAMREHIERVLLGKVKRRRGRPAGVATELRFVHEFRALLYRIARYKRVYERRKQRTGATFKPYEMALWKVAEETGIPEATLDKWCYPR